MNARGLFNFIFTYAWTGSLASVVLLEHAIKEDPERFRAMERTWAKVLAKAWGLQVATYGAEKVDPTRAYIFMGNHQSQVDIVAVMHALPQTPGFLAKKELRKIPFMGRAMEVGGHVFIDRGRRERAIAAVEDAAKVIRAGSSIVVFPEGTRMDREEVGPFKKGPFHLAMTAGVPIIPFGIRGTRSILPKHSSNVVPGSIEVHIGKPVDASEIKNMSIETLMARVRSDIATLSAMPLSDQA
ncbi:MAG: 1-acyl-sn-glycerol-3-phosphate acyltransferase [Sandaracinaceae bacterium]|nr:1-acyl-sn-glycerol-3-phosphate acyltransferase [Sandaracinaceae bacterium]